MNENEIDSVLLPAVVILVILFFTIITTSTRIVKMLTRLIPKSKDKLFAVFITLLLVVSAMYFYLSNLQEKRTVQSSGERCISELSSLKYQLNEVTQYKNRIDKLLTETQQAHESDKERFKDIMESCVAMKQQTVLCQSQFEDLQSECKKVRDDYNKLKKSLKK